MPRQIVLAVFLVLAFGVPVNAQWNKQASGAQPTAPAAAQGTWNKKAPASSDGTAGVDSADGADGAAEPEVSQDDALAMAQDTFLAIFYHELGHALIDVMDLPVLGLEEDAADVLSVLLIDQLWDAASSEDKLRSAAGFWAASAAHWAEAGEAPATWGVHSPDERRYFTYVCLYYGADPGAREAFAQDLGLPEARADTCPREHDLAFKSWGVFLDEVYGAGSGTSLIWDGDASDDPFTTLLRDEVAYLNEAMGLPKPVRVQIAECGEANAFYDPDTKSVTMCRELIGYLVEADAGNM